mmetsp:Transcript_32583/g.65849  ORF Transcript_32583/g.65849 Transcript_32583/m.65849 type:complete len:389 (-) Transcript_32583:248-1414(-)
MEQSDGLGALRAHAHLHPRPAVGLPSAPAVQPVEAGLAEEVPAIVTEENGVSLIALDTHLHLLDLPRLCVLGLLELTHQVPVPQHEVPEVLHVLDLPLLAHGMAVVAERSPQDVHKVWLLLDDLVDVEYSCHLEHVIDRLHQRRPFPVLVDRVPEHRVEEELDAEGHDRFPVGQRLLGPCNLQHPLVLVVQRVIPVGLLCLGVEPVHHSILDVLEVVRRLGLLHEVLDDPPEVLVSYRVKAEIPHVLLHRGTLVVCAMQDPVHRCLHISALLQGDLDLVSGDSEGAPRPLVEEPHVPVVFALDDCQELVPNIRYVCIPLKHREVLGDRTLGQVEDLELRPEGALARHEDYLILIPFDDDFVANRDVVLPFYLVLGRICPLVLEAEGHD